MSESDLNTHFQWLNAAPSTRGYWLRYKAMAALPGTAREVARTLDRPLRTVQRVLGQGVQDGVIRRFTKYKRSNAYTWVYAAESSAPYER